MRQAKQSNSFFSYLTEGDTTDLNRDARHLNLALRFLAGVDDGNEAPGLRRHLRAQRAAASIGS